MLDIILYRHSDHSTLPPRLVRAKSKEVFLWRGGYAFLIFNFSCDIFAAVLCISIMPKTGSGRPCTQKAGTSRLRLGPGEGRNLYLEREWSMCLNRAT